MPTIQHSRADDLNAFAASRLNLRPCREWRPRDSSDAAPARALKRGPDTPILVEFSLSAAAPGRRAPPPGPTPPRP